jgi:hypothetical protein
MTLGPGLYPPLAWFRLRCINLNQVAWRRRTPYCVSRHCDDTCIDAARRTCVPCERNLFLSTPRNPCSYPTFRPERSAWGGACAPLIRDKT